MSQSRPKSDDNEPDMFIVITGDPVEGFIFTGPFQSHQAAERWAEGQQEWWTALLRPPDQRTA
jgi:hypothetical protein